MLRAQVLQLGHLHQCVVCLLHLCSVRVGLSNQRGLLHGLLWSHHHRRLRRHWLHATTHDTTHGLLATHARRRLVPERAIELTVILDRLHVLERLGLRPAALLKRAEVLRNKRIPGHGCPIELALALHRHGSE